MIQFNATPLQLSIVIINKMYDFSVAPEPFFDNDTQWYKTNFPSFLIMLNSDARCRHNERIKHTQIYIFAFLSEREIEKRIHFGSCITTTFGLSAKSKSFIFHAIICSPLFKTLNIHHPAAQILCILYLLVCLRFQTIWHTAGLLIFEKIKPNWMAVK